jgi:hypothetical protein
MTSAILPVRDDCQLPFPSKHEAAMPLLRQTISRWTWLAILDATVALALAASASTWAHASDLSAAEIVALRFYGSPDTPDGTSLADGHRHRGQVLAYARHGEGDNEFATDDSEQDTGMRARPAERSLPAIRKSMSFLTETQISIIKGRLKLMPHQERYWPAVESALRGVFLRKTREGATILDSASVQRLYAAAAGLVRSLDAAQLREVQRLARLVGLDH